MERKIRAVYFSPTHGTKKLTLKTAGKLSEIFEAKTEEIDLTLVKGREKEIELGEKDILVFGFPVYGGRIPLLLEPVIKKIKGNGNPVVIMAVYGNRDFDDAILEARDIFIEKGFKVVSAGAFIGEHSYTENVGTGRPDTEDLKEAEGFAEKTARKIKIGDNAEILKVSGNKPYKERSAGIAAAPETGEACYDCMKCAEECPVSAISYENTRIADINKCIHCCACVKACPVKAKYFDNEMMKNFSVMLETKFAEKKENIIFI